MYKSISNSKRKENIIFPLLSVPGLKGANQVENFRYRIIDKQAFIFDQVNASPTINRPNGTFGFAYMNYDKDESRFYAKALEETDKVRNSENLLPSVSGENVIHFSAIPWLRFTSISHARGFSFPDSSPKISFGKMEMEKDKRTMPVSVHVHHALVDGSHIGLFIEVFQNLMDGKILDGEA